MNYIYDILLNFQEVDYEFYEWNLNDSIIHIRKIPLIRISRTVMSKIINYEFSISLDFLKKISNRTEFFCNKSIKIMKYVCLFSDGYEVIAIQFNNDGKKNKISHLLLDEKEEVIEIANNIENIKIDINVLRKKEIKNFRTRTEQEIYRYIKKEFKKNNYELLKYIYFECFNKEENDYEMIIERLKKEIDKNWSLYYQKIFNILKLSSMKKSRN